MKINSPCSEKSLAALSQMEVNEAMLSGSSILDAVYRQLQSTNPAMQGYGYMLTSDNALPSGFLQQTPNVWGEAAGAVPMDAGIGVAHQIQRLIATAEQFIDITTLAPFPDGDFFNAIQQGLLRLVNNGNHIYMRILAGWYPGNTAEDQMTYLRQLIAPFQDTATNLHICVAPQRSSTVYATWNHSKIVAVDGKRAILGGENQWDANYLGPYPVHDLNVMVSGSSVFYMHRFIDHIWQEVCGYSGSWRPVYWSQATGITYRCISHSLASVPPGDGQIAILGAGRYGGSSSANDNPADQALLYCINSATQSICIAQQDLGNNTLYWEAGMEAIAAAIIRGVNVKIVISNDYGRASATRDPSSSKYDSYSTATQEGTILKIWEYIYTQALSAGLSREKLEQMAAYNFLVAVLRFGPSDTWTNGWEFANHAKFLMVDDRVFFVGSENLYPANLIEYGVFIEDPDTVASMKQNYWDKLWQYSSRTASNSVV